MNIKSSQRWQVFFSLLFLFSNSTAFSQSVKVKEVLRPTGPEGTLMTQWATLEGISRPVKLSEPRVIREIPEFLLEGGDEKTSSSIYRETLYPVDQIPKNIREFSQKASQEESAVSRNWVDTEVRTLVDQGPSNNRIVLTILGDGYTLAEKDRFFQDAQRITDDLFGESTFKSYLPLFNVYAVFVPSSDSGITDQEKKNTAFGLYRSPAGSKRGILPGNTSAIEKALKLAPAAADYPIIIANDDYYGGLGGRYAISTRSVRSGSIVLRHELGHNFGNVGEEYDGGQVYQGANYSSASKVSWAHWIEGAYQPQEKISLHGSYVWKNLKSGSYLAEFEVPAPTKDGPYRLEILVSSVGWKTLQDVQVRLDGLPIELKGEFTDDRWFYQLNELSELSPGKHTLEFKEMIRDGDNVLAFVRIDALAAGYSLEPMRWGAFRNYSQFGKAGWRPSHASCLMRDMTLKHFCSVDIENMWVRFLDRVSLIDAFTQAEDTVSVQTPGIEGIKVFWFRGQEEMTSWRNLKKVSLDSKKDRGKYRVRVQFQTPEVRKPLNGFVTEKEFTY